jgi:hypothetical protein
MFTSTRTRKLRPNTVALWEKEGTEHLLEGFAQLVELLETPILEPGKSE